MVLDPNVPFSISVLFLDMTINVEVLRDNATSAEPVLSLVLSSLMVRSFLLMPRCVTRLRKNTAAVALSQLRLVRLVSLKKGLISSSLDLYHMYFIRQCTIEINHSL